MKNVILILAVLLAVSTVNAAVVFNDDFESGLAQWTGKSGGAHNGIITQDPLNPNNNALAFKALNGGGDIFSYPAIVLQQGETYELTLDYLGYAKTGSVPDNFGGFLGIGSHYSSTSNWIMATNANYGGIVEHLIDDNQWHSYSYSFVASNNGNFHISMEDYSGSGGTVGDSLFDNLKLTLIPEPCSLMLLGFAIPFLRRRR